MTFSAITTDTSARPGGLAMKTTGFALVVGCFTALLLSSVATGGCGGVTALLPDDGGTDGPKGSTSSGGGSSGSSGASSSSGTSGSSGARSGGASGSSSPSSGGSGSSSGVSSSSSSGGSSSGSSDTGTIYFEQCAGTG